MCQNLQVQIEELKSVNKSFDLLIVAQCEKIRLLEEQSTPLYEVHFKFDSESFDDEKKVFENMISKLEILAQRVKDFDDVKTELSRRTDKFETYFANLEKENALLKSQLASQNCTSLQKENNDLRTSYNVLKEEYEISCAKLEKENNNLKMDYKILFDSIKQKKIASQVFTKSVPKVNASDKIYMGESSKPISKMVSQFTTYSLQKDRKY
nr:outer membrane protein porin [Tanacetum cinerariifolium]GEZ90850.1 outer membrane protein porin [Tanacetum cinerariifolium]